MHIKRLSQRILKSVNQANRFYGLIGEGDRILVAMSGGKDSYCLLWALQELQAAAAFKFSLVLYHLDQAQPGHDAGPLDRYMARFGLPYEVELQDTYSRVIEKTAAGKAYCSLCSRFRRAILYKAAARHGCNKVALGHHRDDLIETLLLSIFFSGQIKSMPPKLQSERGTEQVIRPLCLVPEEECAELAAAIEAPILPCRLCGSQERQRVFVKNMLAELTPRFPHLKGNLLASLGNLQPDHLMDPRHNPLLVTHAGAALEAAAHLADMAAEGGAVGRPQAGQAVPLTLGGASMGSPVASL